MGGGGNKNLVKGGGQGGGGGEGASTGRGNFSRWGNEEIFGWWGDSPTCG